MSKPSPVQYVMVPVPIQLQQDSDKDEEKEKSKFSIFGAFFWAIILLFALWFITGGYNALR